VILFLICLWLHIQRHWGCFVCVSKWQWTNLFWNILLTSMECLENIIWHMEQNIWWHEKIFCHVFMDEIYSRMKFWMTNENGWTFHECWQYTFFVKNWTKKKGGKHLCWFILKFLTHEMFKSYFKSYFVFFQYEVY
jgi:hypothetical protein